MLTRIVAILFLSGAAGVVHSGLAPFRLTFAEPPPEGTGAASVHRSGFIDVEAVRTHHGDPATVFIDASRSEDYRRGHIPGALSLQPEEFVGGSFPTSLEPVPHTADIVVYCSGPTCDAALMVALRLREFGFQGTVVFEAGLEGWKAAGGAVEGDR